MNRRRAIASQEARERLAAGRLGRCEQLERAAPLAVEGGHVARLRRRGRDRQARSAGCGSRARAGSSPRREPGRRTSPRRPTARRRPGARPPRRAACLRAPSPSAPRASQSCASAPCEATRPAGTRARCADRSRRSGGAAPCRRPGSARHSAKRGARGRRAAGRRGASTRFRARSRREPARRDPRRPPSRPRSGSGRVERRPRRTARAASARASSSRTRRSPRRPACSTTSSECGPGIALCLRFEPDGHVVRPPRAPRRPSERRRVTGWLRGRDPDPRAERGERQARRQPGRATASRSPTRRGRCPPASARTSRPRSVSI